MRLFLSLCACLGWATAAYAGDSSAQFEAPVRLKAGDQYMGAKRLYPSPVMHDLDGDGRMEIVIGDLIGNLTFCTQKGEAWGSKESLKGADGKPLKFHNW